MHLRPALLLALSLALAVLAPAALADPTGLTPDYDPNWYQAAGATWTQSVIKEADGTQLHVDVLRPKGATDADKTPVVLSIGPYFNHSGQVGPAAPAENTSYYPVGENGIGPSDRFSDFVLGSGLIKKGYAFVMVDLRGFGASTGCPDWGGPGEQADVAAAIRWSATQPWSTGLVGTYGKSYDAETGLIAVALHPAGLGAVVSQEPVYDDYRYLYGDGMRRENALATPALYDAIATTPGPLLDSADYNQSSLTTPDCTAQNFASQASDDDHTSDFWKARDLIAKVKGSTTPLFLTQGLTENNTAPDGTAEFLGNHGGFERGWLGPWEHVRGNETCAAGDGSTGCGDYPVGRLKEGRHGWFDEVMRFYDRFLKGQDPAIQDPPFAVQTNDGKWRGEASWPPADSTPFTTPLNKGSYTDTAQSSGYGDTGQPGAQPGVWTISPVLDHEVDLSGSPTARVNVTTATPDENLVVDVYDLDGTGVGPLVSRQGFLVRTPGTQDVTLRMWSADWRFAAGHRIGVRVTDNNSEWWVLAAPTGSDVTVNGGSIDLPFLKFARPDTIEGDPGVQLASYLKQTEDASAELPAAQSAAFNVPPPLAAPAPGDPGTPEAIAAANQRAADQADQQVAAATVPGAGSSPARHPARRRLTVRILRVAHHRHTVRATGRAPAGARVLVRLVRGRHVAATRRVRAGRKGAYAVTFRHVRKGRYQARSSVMAGATKLHARTRTIRVR